MQKNISVNIGKFLSVLTLSALALSASSTLVASAATPTLTTEAATGVTASDATLNAFNGNGYTSDSSFWVSTSTFSTEGPELPTGVYSTADLGVIAPYTTFSASLSSVMGILPITPNTTYYFAAWSNVDGAWYRGAVMNFITPDATSTSTIGGTVTSGAGTLKVDSITPVKTSAVANDTYADGLSYLFNITVPTNEPDLSMKFADWLAADSNTMPVANNMRISSAQAFNTAPVTITAANTYSLPALDMVGDMSTSTPGLQVQVLVQTKIPLNTVNEYYTTNYLVQTLP
ncbi:MAG: hypothetical protein WCI89_01615 [bacterium]